MTYVFDLDGTLCETDGMEYTKALPILERIRRVNALYDEGHTVIIDTARGSGNGVDWGDVTRRQLQYWGVKYHRLRTGEKIPADVYVDDRAVNAGDW